MIPDFPHNIRIGLAKLIFFCCTLTLLSLCPVGCLSSAFLNGDSQQGRDLATSGLNKKNQLCQSLYYIMRKVWYHQIWIQTNFGFMVSDLKYIPKEAAITLCCLDKQKFRKSAGMATLHDIIRTKRGNAIFRQKCVCSWSFKLKSIGHLVSFCCIIIKLCDLKIRRSRNKIVEP